MKFNSYDDLAKTLEERLAAVPVAIQSGLKAAGELVRDKAREMIGEYHPAIGDLPAWAPLKEATKAERARLGFAPDEPLLRTGLLRDAIETRSVPNGVRVGVFGDNELAPVAFAQELGTQHIPPRAFVRGAGFLTEGPAAQAIGSRVRAALEGKDIE